MVRSGLNARVLLWLGALLLPFVLIAALNAALRNAPQVAPEFLYESAEVIESPAMRPGEVPASGWQPVTLPA